MKYYEVPGRLWEEVGTDMCSLYNKNYLCPNDCHRKIPAIKKTEGLSADNLILACKVICSEYGLSKEIMSDEGDNFVSEKLNEFAQN